MRARTRAKNECHAVLARNLKGKPPMSDICGRKGRRWLAALEAFNLGKDAADDLGQRAAGAFPQHTLQAPHLAISVFGRGLLKRLVTRVYFGDGEGNEDDPILSLVPEERRSTLIATRRAEGDWWFDIVLQGKIRQTAREQHCIDCETVFFDL